jgi:hypothetical protein
MERKGINYDVGIFLSPDSPSREVFDPAIARREIEIIKHDLHCTAIRITGQEKERLMVAAQYALEQGLEVWLTPFWINATEQETLAYLAECAQAAEPLRQQWPQMVFVVGCELTGFMQGLIEGKTPLERMGTFMKPWKLLKSTLVKGPFNRRLNAFLKKATATVREHFHGPLSYASGPWEPVDWSLFDYVGVDYYRDGRNKATYQQGLRKYFTHGKPVVITEFGCCTYQGAEERGSYGWLIVDRAVTPRRLKGSYVRDEAGQATYLTDLLDIFQAEGVNRAFAFTFVSPSYTTSDDPLYDLDMASYSLVKTYPDKKGQTYPDMPWEPKESFKRVAHYYKEKVATTSG